MPRSKLEAWLTEPRVEANSLGFLSILETRISDLSTLVTSFDFFSNSEMRLAGSAGLANSLDSG